MQWDKVKNILIAILLTINLFLLGNLGGTRWQSHRRTSELEANLRTLVSARGMQLDTAFSPAGGHRAARAVARPQPRR